MSNRFAFAVRLENEIEKKKEEIYDAFQFEETKEQIVKRLQEAEEEILERGISKYKRILAIDKLLQKAYEEETGEVSTNWHMITIRPEEGKVTFSDFYEKIYKLVKRECFIDYHLAFEQKNEDGTNVGFGFHCHIVCKVTQKSKTQLVRDLLSSFKKWTDNKIIAENCIQVDNTRNPEEMINNYLMEYKSKDGHKIKTKETDQIWRKQMNIKDYYTKDCEMPAKLSPIKSVGDSKESTIVDFK